MRRISFSRIMPLLMINLIHTLKKVAVIEWILLGINE